MTELYQVQNQQVYKKKQKNPQTTHPTAGPITAIDPHRKVSGHSHTDSHTKGRHDTQHPPWKPPQQPSINHRTEEPS